MLAELTLDAGESVRSVKLRLRRASTRTGAKLEIWDADGKVYFQGRSTQHPTRATAEDGLTI